MTTEKDYLDMSIEQLKTATSNGDAIAACVLGRAYLTGSSDVAKDVFRGFQWIARGAKMPNNALCIYMLAGSFFNGIGVEQDQARAIKYYKHVFNSIKQRATDGEILSQYWLGNYYFYGQGEIAQDQKTAVEWYKKAAEQGLVQAQNILAVCYHYGHGVTPDIKEAIKWLTQAAEGGDASAQCNLGLNYYNGEGVEQNTETAVEWFTKAAKRGNPQAQYYLAECYYKGHGIEKDKTKGIEWCMKAAEQGHADAQNNLGVFYFHGEGVGQDRTKAVKWWSAAAEQGHAEAKEALKHIYG